MGFQIFLGMKVVMYNGGWELLLRMHRDSSLASCNLRPSFNDQGDCARAGKKLWGAGKKLWTLYAYTYRGVPTDQLKSNRMVMSDNRLILWVKKGSNFAGRPKRGAISDISGMATDPELAAMKDALDTVDTLRSCLKMEQEDRHDAEDHARMLEEELVEARLRARKLMRKVRELQRKAQEDEHVDF